MLSTRWELGSIAGIDFKTTPSHSATMFRVRTQQGSKDNVLIGRLIATANAPSAPLAALPDVEEPANRPMAADAVAGVGARKHRRPQQERDFGGHRPAPLDCRRQPSWRTPMLPHYGSEPRGSARRVSWSQWQHFALPAWFTRQCIQPPSQPLRRRRRRALPRRRQTVFGSGS